MKTALLFAGQATQYVGMGRALYDRFPEARAVFERVDEALGERLSALCFEGPEARLNLTANTQPAVLTVACAAWAVLDARGFTPTVVAGHSLGEFGALVAAEALALEDAARLTRRRGAYMQAATPEGLGAMAAIQRLEDEVVEAACRAAGGVCVPAAFNAPGLIVISGEAPAVARAMAALEAAGGIVTPLSVSAPFHTPLLAPAADQLAADLAQVPLAPLRCPYVDNVDATWIEISDAEAIRARLVRQVVEPVRWRQSLALMLAHGVERFLHLGPGRSNLTHVKRLRRKAPMASLDDARDLDALLEELK
ncbi:ACP S-malonyltransferase [Myxococcota bacterium]|nr:ACP S-malonyltransferase [Myxococcota bacterium]MBU1430886.1 ACP S-malonyltransferase [Myxococcota bacterium]MBU1900172.1 ACP S-malonyltransferase [Myxococcota bacterium]